jgi:hypothetical protein
MNLFIMISLSLMGFVVIVFAINCCRYVCFFKRESEEDNYAEFDENVIPDEQHTAESIVNHNPGTPYLEKHSDDFDDALPHYIEVINHSINK